MKSLNIDLELGDYGFRKSWLEARREEFDVLHFHWLHLFYRVPTLDAALVRCAHFLESLAFAKSIGYRIVYTIHNLFPHERPFPEVDRIAHSAVFESAHHIIAHCEYGVRAAARFFHRTDRISIIPHGNFIDIFPNNLRKVEARKALGISDDAFVYVYFGNARAYKGIESLIEAFATVKDPNARLLLMMRNAFDPSYGEQIADSAKGDSRVLIFTSSFFDEAEFQQYLNTGDFAVFPFSDVMTSGSTITGLGFGLPAIVPRLGCLPELIDSSCGLTYDAGDEKALAEALNKVRALDVEALRKGALDRARSLDWAEIAKQTADIYRGDVAAV